MTRTRVNVAVLAVAMALLLAVWPLRGAATASPDPPTIPDMLGLVEVAPEEDADSYDRELFGYSSSPVRDELAEQELLVDEGRYLSQWDGEFHDTIDSMDADHTVSLAEAWRSGASEWGDGMRATYANDTDNHFVLNLVTRSLNRGEKSDKDPADWIPATNYCHYGLAWLRTKLLYELTVDSAEYEALAVLGEFCTDGTGPMAEALEPSPEPEPQPAPQESSREPSPAPEPEPEESSSPAPSPEPTRAPEPSPEPERESSPVGDQSGDEGDEGGGMVGLGLGVGAVTAAGLLAGAGLLVRNATHGKGHRRK